MKRSRPKKNGRFIEENFMAPGASAAAERPVSNVLCEREALLKAAGFAIEEGVLDPACYGYATNPAMMQLYFK
jgi:hypothetical protein